MPWGYCEGCLGDETPWNMLKGCINGSLDDASLEQISGMN